MADRFMICKGDKTTHGGTVLEGVEYYTIEDVPVATKGHLVYCPLCKGNFPILEGVDTYIIDDAGVALEGMLTGCGARLIASQKLSSIEDDSWIPGSHLYEMSAKTVHAQNIPKNHFASTAPYYPDEETQVAECIHSTDGAIEVAKYIVDEIQRNAKSPIAKMIKNHNDSYHRLQEWLTFPAWKQALFPQPEIETMQAMTLWASKVFKNQDWDHKPKIRDNLALNAVAVHRPLRPKESLELSKRYYHKYKKYDYFYDVWSNIHYGYIGLLVGFDRNTLLGGADSAQLIDSKGANTEDTPDDKISIEIGFALFEKFGENINNLIAQDILDMLDMTDPKKMTSSKQIHWCFNSENPNRLNP